MNYKKTIDEFLGRRYKYLLECSRNILKYNNNIEPEELLSELTIHLYDNEEKISEYINMGKLEGFAISFMTIQGKYITSPINKKHSSREFELSEDYDVPSIEEDVELDGCEYERDLRNILNEEQVGKIMKLNTVLTSLTRSEEILFNAYFVENLSYDKICRKYTFYREKDGKRVNYKSKKSIYTLMMGLKSKIIENL